MKPRLWAVAFLAMTVIGTYTTAQENPPPLRTEFLMELRADLEPPQQVGETPLGVKSIFYAKGGSFSGPKLKGQVLPGGGDWALLRQDGVWQLDFRVTLRTNDGAVILVSYRGLADIPPQVRQRIADGEDVSPSEYYFRTIPVFECASEKYAWLNRLVTVGVGKRTETSVIYQIYAVK